MSQGNDANRSAIRDMFDEMVKEFGWAVQDARHEVVERGWFGRETTPESVHTLGNPFEDQGDTMRPEDLYGRDAGEITTDEISTANGKDPHDFWDAIAQEVGPGEAERDQEIER